MKAWVFFFTAIVCYSSAAADTVYVSTNSASNGPGTAWSNAFHTIQAAVDAATPGDTVLVTNGVYSSGGRPALSYQLNNRVVITKNIEVRSVNGPTNTFIVGASDSGSNGPGAVRGVFMNAGMISGFTVTNGNTLTNSPTSHDQRGGGVLCYYGAPVVSRCVITGNAADLGGGGILLAGGTPLVDRCEIRGNACLGAGSDGGGLAFYSGDGVLRNSLITGNTAANTAGGVFYYTAASNSVMESCTLTENSSGVRMWNGTVRNCIVSGNTNSNWSIGGNSPLVEYTCTMPANGLPGGVGCIDADPQFVGGGDYRLMRGSACIDAGSNQIWMVSAVDFEGTRRILDEFVNMGAFESVPNHAPTIAEILEVTILEDSETSSVELHVSDEDNDRFTLSATLDHSDLATLETESSWVQKGADIDGDSRGEQSGSAVSLSADGLTVAVGALAHGGFNGAVRVYKQSDGSWIQAGDILLGENYSDRLGKSVSLNEDGSILAVGVPYHDGEEDDSGEVRIYKYVDGGWILQGAAIDGILPNAHSGWSVSLSADGLTVAIGAPGNADGEFVRIYQYSGGSWVQLGADIREEVAGAVGWSVSLSADGLTIAVGAPANSNPNGFQSGHARIYTYDEGTWIQLGEDINGRAENDLSGNSVSLSSDGSTIAVGSDVGAGFGYTRIYRYDGSSWVQLGADIYGEEPDDSSGYSVSLSSNGVIVAIGAPGNNGTGGENDWRGHVRNYKYNGSSWLQLNADIDGERSGDRCGWSVSLCSDGSRVAIGAKGNDGVVGGTYDCGHVRVYDAMDLLRITPKPNANGTAEVTIHVDDGMSQTNTSFTLNVSSVNDAPASSDVSFTIDENRSKRFALNDFAFTDVDAGDSLNALVVATLPGAGSLQLNGTDVIPSQQIDSASISNLKFTPATNAGGIPYTNFRFLVNDGFANSVSSYVVTMDVRPDSDDDGMPDAWEALYGLNPTNAADAASHLDSDPFTCVEEYIADTDPTNAASCFRIDSFSTNTVYFDSSSNRLYSLLLSTNLIEGTWTTAAPVRMGIGGNDSLTSTNTVSVEFYKLSVDLP